MTIKDSGARRKFDTGAVRDIAEGKGRCDLLPLGVVSEYLEDELLKRIEQYIREGDVKYLFIALDLFYRYLYPNSTLMILEVAKQYEEGAKKYEDRNWEKGIPLHCFIDSAIRHYFKWKLRLEDEPHHLAFVWNILGAIWTHQNRPEMIDLPFKDEKIEKIEGETR